MNKYINTLNDTYNITDKLFAYLKNGKSNQHEIFIIAKAFTETSGDVKLIEKYFIVFTAFVKILVPMLISRFKTEISFCLLACVYIEGGIQDVGLAAGLVSVGPKNFV